MSYQIPTPEYSTSEISTSPATSAHPAPKPQRILACRSCQQRKVKCDRKFPCSHCTKAGIQCVSAQLLPRQRRRRFPERVLLDRLRHYEQLLTQHHIPFEPLHSVANNDESTLDRELDQSTREKEDTEQLTPHTLSGTVRSGASSPTKNFWHAMNRKTSIMQNGSTEMGSEQDTEDDESDDSSYLLRENDVKNAWDSLYDSSDQLLFCSPDSSLDLASLHPSHIHTFQLWQIYLENVDPLLKVTHTPTLQPRIISAASNPSSIDLNLQALMFSIYCMAVFSMTHLDCQTQFGAPRNDLLRTFQSGAKQALLRCGFLKSTDRDCLTALHFYLISIKPATDPRSLSSMLGAATRIAQRMGIHDEISNSKHTTLEAELRRRLWWSMVLFDARISEMTEFKTGLLVPTWTCRTPSNTNDFDLRSVSRGLPTSTSATSEALFAVIRSEMGDFVRFSDFHLDFINPALKAVAHKGVPPSGSGIDEFDALEALIEEKYIRHCDLGNPLHYMTTWWARGQVARNRFVHILSKYTNSKTAPTDAQRDAGVTYALRMLECDTKAMSSKLTHGFRWLLFLNFPFPAYVHVVQDLRKRPMGDHAAYAWETMSQNCMVRFLDFDSKNTSPFPMEKGSNPFFKIFAGVVMAAWEAREAALLNSGVVETQPTIVTQLKKKLSQSDSESNLPSTSAPDVAGTEASNADLAMPELVSPDMGYSFGADNSARLDLDPFALINMQATLAAGMNQWGWPSTNWNPHTW